MPDYSDLTPTPLSTAKDGDQAALRRDARACINHSENVLGAALRRMDKADQLDALAKGPCPVTSDPECHCPRPTPSPTPPDVDLRKHPLPDIDSGFTEEEYQSLLQERALPESAAPDVVGAFRMNARVSHMLVADPIVYPGQENAGHPHVFWGNTETDAHSTYFSLRSSGDSTALNALNRSAYWAPPLIDGMGHWIRPKYIMQYYKARPSDAPELARLGMEPIQIPNGLMQIAGERMDEPGLPSEKRVTCNLPGRWASITDMLADPGISREEITTLYFSGSTGNCWDGENLDSPDHRSHVQHLKWNGGTGHFELPTSKHRWLVPTITVKMAYDIPRSLDLSKVKLSSDDMAGKAPGGSFHFDTIFAWDKRASNAIIDHAINQMLNCSAGDFGNGTGMAHDWSGKKWDGPYLNPLPEMGVGHEH